MVDPEAVRRRLRDIDRRLLALRKIRDRGSEAFLSDPDLRTLCERHLQIVLQAAIDVAVHILAEDSASTPEDYGSAFLLLAESQVVDEALAERLRKAAGLRNILVHAYLEVDHDRLWDDLSGLEDLEAFAAAVEEYLGRRAP